MPPNARRPATFATDPLQRFPTRRIAESIQAERERNIKTRPMTSSTSTTPAADPRHETTAAELAPLMVRYLIAVNKVARLRRQAWRKGGSR